MMKIRLFILCFVLSGCSTYETAWQAMHVIDIGQTLSIAKNDCYWEDDPVTRKLIGKYPDQDSVIRWGVATSILHFSVSRWFPKALKAFDLAFKGNYIVHNYNVGLRLNKGGLCE